MLMAAGAAYMHTDSTHSAGSTISPPPWHPAVPVATHQQHQAAVLYDPADLTTPSPSPSPSPPPRNNHHHQQKLRPGMAARRPSSTRRRQRPSRKVATTYITADPASFRRMVHQVTGADDLLPPLAPRPVPPPHEMTTLCRPAPTRAAASAGALPTLDTSALLLGSGSARRTTAWPAASVRPASEVVDLGAGGGVGVGLGRAGYYGGSDCGAGAGGGFPTLESWDVRSLL